MKVLKFGAVWCSGCLVMRPRWQEVEAENPWLKTEYHDFDTDNEAVTRHKIGSGKLPTFIFLDNNEKEILRLSGEVQKSEILKAIEENRNR